jgi:hypothetical protein
MASMPADLMTDEAEIRRLNDRYYNSFLQSDVDWYDQYLVDDFTCMMTTGTIVDKQEFLRLTSEGPGEATYDLRDVRVRVYPGAALFRR